jgi:hypothetical protein
MQAEEHSLLASKTMPLQDRSRPTRNNIVDGRLQVEKAVVKPFDGGSHINKAASLSRLDILSVTSIVEAEEVYSESAILGEHPPYEAVLVEVAAFTVNMDNRDIRPTLFVHTVHVQAVSRLDSNKL